MILDSGSRREFSTGAVRDIQEGKGRPSLVPLFVAAKIMDVRDCGDVVLHRIAQFKDTGETFYLFLALREFAGMAFNHSCETMLLEVSIHFEEGAKKYGDNNWQRGIPVECYLDSALRHYWKYRRGDNDERHDRAFVWNIMCCVWEVEHRDKD